MCRYVHVPGNREGVSNDGTHLCPSLCQVSLQQLH